MQFVTDTLSAPDAWAPSITIVATDAAGCAGVEYVVGDVHVGVTITVAAHRPSVAAGSPLGPVTFGDRQGRPVRS